MIIRSTDVVKRFESASAHADAILDDPAFDLNDLDRIDEIFDDVFRPTEGANPMSKWTKKAILENARKGGISESGLDTLRRMKLDDLHGVFLKKDGVFLCGSGSQQGACRHTIYYVLDLDYMREFLDEGGKI